ncbi:MAG: FAD-dependent oxidoreductase, partial [Hyphomonadaceae bacterium]
MNLETFETDAIVIGAGAVGLACAAELARRGQETLVLERAAIFGSGTSSRNSEVIHAGIYYPTGSLKHLLCIEGRRRLYAYLAARRVAHRTCGKWIVATDEKEEAGIHAIHARAQENGVDGLRFVTGAEAMAEEPNLRCVAAVESRETGLIDSHGYMLALIGDIESASGSVIYGTSLARAEILPDGRIAVETEGAAPARVICRRLVNAAGLHAQSVAAKFENYDKALIPRQYLAKGSYFGCTGKPAFSRLIYPAPVDGGLGTHITLDLAGRMRFGPDVEWLTTDDPDTVDYTVDIRRADSFYAAIRRYWPGLPDGALTPDYAGLRPKLSGPGQPAADFRIDGPALHGHAGLVHLFGIESPGLTSSLAIAARVGDALFEKEAAAPSAAPLRRAVFFDRDGVLNENIGYPHKSEDLIWREGAQEAVRAVNEAGMLAIVVTNQSGIGRGLFDEAAMHDFHAIMQRDLAAIGARIDAFYFCPYHEDATIPAYRRADHPDRKPNPGMILRAAADCGIDLARSWLVGDSPSDL